MSNVSEWSTTAASNNSASPNGAPEGMAPSGVNDVIRENMAASAKVYKDQQGGLVTTGSANTYLLTTNNVHTTLADIGLTVVRINATNTGASTLNIDSLGAKSLEANSIAVYPGMLQANSLYAVAYNSTNDTFDIMGISNGPVLLSSQTASASSSIDFVLPSGFDSYVVKVLDVKLATDAIDLHLLTSTNGGSSYDTGGTDYAYQYVGANAAGAPATEASASAAQIVLNIANLGNDTNEFASMIVECVRPANANYTTFLITGAGIESTGNQINWSGYGRRLSAADVDAIRFIAASGNITSGIFKLYGIR